MRHFHGYYLSGMTFGMNIDATTAAYRALKKHTSRKAIVGKHGIVVNILVCPAKYVAAVMRDAGWTVREKRLFFKFDIEGFQDGEHVYIEYPNGIRLGG